MSKVELDPEEVAYAMEKAAQGPSISEQEYWYRVRKVVDSIVYEENNNIPLWDLIYKKVSLSYIRVKGLWSAPIAYHENGISDPFAYVSGGEILRGLGSGYMAADVREELDREVFGRNGYTVSYNDVLQRIDADYNQISEVYIKTEPHKKVDSHLLFIVYSKGARDKKFPEGYTTDLVSVGSKEFPFAVMETGNKHRLPLKNNMVHRSSKNSWDLFVDTSLMALLI
jgi:hypothetical protein